MELLVSQIHETSLNPEEWQGTQRKKQHLCPWRRAEKNVYHFPQTRRWCLTLWRTGFNFKRVRWHWCYADGLFVQSSCAFLCSWNIIHLTQKQHSYNMLGFFYVFERNLFMWWWQSWIIWPCVTWSFSIHSNILIWCSRNIYNHFLLLSVLKTVVLLNSFG